MLANIRAAIHLSLRRAQCWLAGKHLWIRRSWTRGGGRIQRVCIWCKKTGWEEQ